MIAGFVLVAVLVVLAGFVLRAAQESAVATLKSHLEQEALSADLVQRTRAALFEARRYDQEFWLNRRQVAPEEVEARYLRPVRDLLNGVRQDLGKLQGAIDDPAVWREIRQVEQALGEYESGFASVGDLYARMGSPRGGLEAQIVEEADRLEAVLGQQGNAALARALQGVRLHQNAYFLSRREADAISFSVAARQFEQEVARGGLSTPVQRTLEASAGRYRALFADYLDLSGRVEARRSAYGQAAAGIDPALGRLLSQVRSGRVLTYYSVSLSDAIGYTAGIVGLITILAAGWMALTIRRSFTRSVDDSIDFARRVEMGDYNARVPAAQVPALDRLGTSLNAMADALHSVRLDHSARAQELQKTVDTLGTDLAAEKTAAQASRARIAELERAVTKSAEAVEAVHRDLKARNHEMLLLNELSSLLHTCGSDRDTFEVIRSYSGRLFPQESGALYLLNAARDELTCQAEWGEHSPGSDHGFGPDGCLALRLGHVHQVDDPQSAPVCGHVRELGQAPRPYLCVPLAAGGEILGIFHLSFEPGHPEGEVTRSGESAPGGRGSAGGETQEHLRDLAIALGDQISLAVSNLRLRESLHRQAIRDPLSGLFNRRYLEESLHREIARAERNGETLALLMLDVDHFKNFNDSFGHEAGDSVLRALARLLKQNVREGDVACRFGGEEFIILLPDTTLEIAQKRAETVRQAAGEISISRAGRNLDPVSVSFGISIYPDHGTSTYTLLAAADAALYRAKQAGRNRVVVALHA